MPDNTLASSPLSLSGDRLLTPALPDTAQNVYRIVLEGVLHNRYNDTEFDALYRCGERGAGDAALPHDYLQWTPQRPPLEQADPIRHRYVFRVPAEWKLNGQSVGVRLNVDQFV